MFVACGIWCLADVSSVSPSSEQTETESSAKSEVRRSSTTPKTKPKPICHLNWIKISSRRTDQITENNLQEMAAWLFSAVFVKAKKQRVLNTD